MFSSAFSPFWSDRSISLRGDTSPSPCQSELATFVKEQLRNSITLW